MIKMTNQHKVTCSLCNIKLNHAYKVVDPKQSIMFLRPGDIFVVITTAQTRADLLLLFQSPSRDIYIRVANLFDDSMVLEELGLVSNLNVELV